MSRLLSRTPPVQVREDSTTNEAERYDAPVFVFAWRKFAASSMAHGQAEHRRRLLAGLTGRVLEIGAGEGLNFGFYPATVDEVVAIEPENQLRQRAIRTAQQAPVPISVQAGIADNLRFEGGEFDAAVCSLVLCSVPDQAAALAVLRRVIRPGGELRFYEHVGAERQPLATFQRIVEPLWSRVGGGCHLTRDTESALRAADFSIEHIDRLTFKPGLLARFSSPHILGVARRI
jgi:ubiquinone/menaquinone biosynthesis C-methylase UbiE